MLHVGACLRCFLRRRTKNTHPGCHRLRQVAVGEAVGTTAGNAFHWKYDFNLIVGGDTWRVHFDDWMFLQPGGVLLNRATVSRWGITLGTVFLSFERVGGQTGQSDTQARANPAQHGAEQRHALVDLPSRIPVIDVLTDAPVGREADRTHAFDAQPAAAFPDDGI